MKKIFIFILVISSLSISASARVDSLFNVLKYHYNGVLAEQLADSLLSINKNKDGELAFIERINYFLDLFSNKITPAKKAQLLSASGYSYNRVGMRDQGLERIQQGIQIAEENGLTKILAEGALNLGQVYSESGHYIDALESLNQALEIFTNFGDSITISYCYNRIGNTYKLMGNYDKAILFLTESLRIKVKYGKNIYVPVTLYSLAEVYNILNNEKETLKYLTLAEKNARLYKDYFYLSKVFILRGKIAFKLKQWSIAHQQIDSAITLANKSKYGILLVELNDLLSQIYKEKGDFQNAYNFHSLSIAISDSIFSQESKSRLEIMRTVFETRKKDSIIRNLELKQQLFTKYFLTLIISLLLIMILIVFYRYRKLQDSKKTIEQKNIKLEESEQKYRTLANGLPIGIYRVSSKGELIFANQALAIIFSYKNIESLYNAYNHQLFFTNGQLYRWQGKVESTEEYTVVTHDSKTLLLLDTGRAVFDENQNIKFIDGIILNLTDARIAENENRQLKIGIEQSANSIVVTNTQGIIEYANKKFYDLTGFSVEEVIGKKSNITKSGLHTNEFYENLWKTISNGDVWSGVIRNKKKDGALFIENITISPVKDAFGRITNYIAIKEDITDKKNTERELIRAKERAEESDRLKSAFLANMSHEIRTPMNGILGFSNLLINQKTEDEDRRQYVKIIQDNCNQLLGIINDLVDISKIEANQVNIIEKKTNLNHLLDDLFLLFNGDVRAKGLKLILFKERKDDKATVVVDDSKLKQLISNLLSNAIKFTAEGFIEFGYMQKENLVEFFVKDSGIGISKDQQTIIFNRFVQADLNVSRKYGGTGLGLSISKGYAELLGGEISIISEDGRGSRFSVMIPLTFITEISFKDKDITDLSAEDDFKWNGKRILIAEDEDYNYIYLHELFKYTGAEVERAKTGEEAIDLYNSGRIFDILLMDIKMPGMSGLEAMKHIKKINPNQIVIMQTAFAMMGDAEKTLNEGADEYLTKPVDGLFLLRTIQKYIGFK